MNESSLILDIFLQSVGYDMDVYNNLFAFIKNNNDPREGDNPNSIDGVNDLCDPEREEEYFEPLKDEAMSETTFREENQDGMSDNSNLRSIKCDECNFTSVSSDRVRNHKESVHLGLLRYFCKLCDYRNYDKSNMQRHMKKYHCKDKELFGTIGCTQCVKENGYHKCDRQRRLEGNGNQREIQVSPIY